MPAAAPGHGDPRRRRIDLRGESGYTLVELLVALVLGIVVSTAMLGIVIISVHFTSNYDDRVDANQQGRIAMQKIVQALGSSCVSSSLPPVLPNTVDSANTVAATSDASDLWFYSSLSDGATVTPNLVDISLTGGSLVMNTYAYSSTHGSAPDWVFSTTPTPFTLLAYATNEVLNGTTLPVFEYYGLNASGTISTIPFAVPLSSANAAATAMVTINFEAIPSDDWTAQGRTASFSNSVILRLTPPSSSSTTPCT